MRRGCRTRRRARSPPRCRRAAASSIPTIAGLSEIPGNPSPFAPAVNYQSDHIEIELKLIDKIDGEWNLDTRTRKILKFSASFV